MSIYEIYTYPTNNQSNLIKDGETFYIESNAGIGVSAYGVAVNNGYEGTEEDWLKTLRVSGDATITGMSDVYGGTTHEEILREIADRINH